MLKKTLNQNHNRNSNLWLGFAFGAISATTIAFFLGTKKGREMLKKLLELSENLEENAIVIAEQIEEAIMEKADKVSEQKQDKPLLGNILEKMKILRN
ncbi:hypothetical protein A2767_06950 [Candidatus Roizmanbacteria bacterium RIFCSPHIGHO2_01_FULL_35_10]|uniref:YtxH domain-containing protein n=1 Tax=Candidatus Roizmanbacteria bacterium RIFCSPLOWO2_01_FULL_35_13 TaxID=1802055 RepID=A0A1F7I7M2_9BACT|nr:MAG: hypothetical protein A2767_06950 [Candidatus Roizmanbacteria bacterium RIFCSPHIGHO2_01_FULL_35_10]OGK39370.1 MAG: hypothetical protein A3A74_05365 [Candidatus Roizmanbacteria bacterium RIFCSPLOWO2_01_FULL_35_13]